MKDFLNASASHSDSFSLIKKNIKEIYNIDCELPASTFFAINLAWPKFNLPTRYEKYVISFHTEYMDVHWIIEQATKVYPKPILLISDFNIEIKEPWPDNIISVRYITFHKQIEIAKKEFGIADINKISKPLYKISSLSYRISQSKKFISAYLLKNFPHNDMILTYHNHLGKKEDNHGYPEQFKIFDSLELDRIGYNRINMIDDASKVNLSPIQNVNWHNPAYTDALINFTNESFHYSLSMFDDKSFQYPGPYLTEKTFKPLLAGRPIVAVGQFQTCKFLNAIGLRTDFGFDVSYDIEVSDLIRMILIFKIVDQIKNTSLDDLYEQSLPAVKYNLDYISNRGLWDFCENANLTSQEIISNFLKI